MCCVQFVSLSVSQSLSLSVSQTSSLSVSLSLCLSVSLSLGLLVTRSLCLSVSLSLFLSVSDLLAFHQSVSLSVYRSVKQPKPRMEQVKFVCCLIRLAGVTGQDRAVSHLSMSSNTVYTSKQHNIREKKKEKKHF